MEAAELLYHYIDGELTTERRILITSHLDDCPPCLDAFDFEADLRTVIAQRCQERVPDRLRQRVAEAIRQLQE
jgi:mycothiol system anti-sigma-R factor